MKNYNELEIMKDIGADIDVDEETEDVVAKGYKRDVRGDSDEDINMDDVASNEAENLAVGSAGTIDEETDKDALLGNSDQEAVSNLESTTDVFDKFLKGLEPDFQESAEKSTEFAPTTADYTHTKLYSNQGELSDLSDSKEFPGELRQMQNDYALQFNDKMEFGNTGTGLEVPDVNDIYGEDEEEDLVDEYAGQVTSEFVTGDEIEEQSFDDILNEIEE
jgi:hypothetical protein